jgi:hypothetical protein
MKINICTWNLLNPEPYISQMTWSNFVPKNQAKTIAKADFKRFDLFRSHAIIKIIKWMCTKSSNPLIICLQEVHPKLLPALKDLIKPDQIAVHQETKINYLVTIVTKGSIESNKSIRFNEKTVLLSKINIQNKIISCVNLHFYWKWSIPEIEIIGSELSYILNEPYVLAGDFNKPIELLEGFIELFDCMLYRPDISSNSNNFTSIQTHTSNTGSIPTYEIIDHILLSSDFTYTDKTKYKILSKGTGYKIFYSFKSILKLQNFNAENWIEKRPNSDISDHKPVFIKGIELN